MYKGGLLGAVYSALYTVSYTVVTADGTKTELQVSEAGLAQMT